MNLHFLDKVKKKFSELWGHKIFRYTLVLHGIFFTLSLIITLLFFPNQNDFRVYYEVGEVVLTDIRSLYTTSYNWPFRYLPVSSLYFVPFYLMGFEMGFIFFNVINLIINILISWFLYKIIILVRRDDHKKDDRRVILYICLYLISLPQVFNYILGQINLYITLLILISLYIFLIKNSLKWDLLGSIILGLSVILKPTTIFMIPFLILIRYDYKQRRLKFQFRKSIIRLVGVILPLLSNLILFLMYPELLTGFLTKNFTGSDTIILNHSFSLTKLISNFLLFINIPQESIPIFQIFLSMFLTVGIIGFLIYILRRKIQNPLLYGYTFGIIIMFLTYFDSWDHHLLNLIPLLTIILFNLPRSSQISRMSIKPSLFFFYFFDLAFMGLFFLTKDFFPFNFASTVFLILSFYGISKHCIRKKNKKEDNR
jgi:hypothetical protein